MIWPALVVILMDQISKLAVMRNLRAHESVPVIGGFFNLVHVRNRGMAFGFLNRPDISFGFYLLVGASLVAIVLLLIWFIKLKEKDNLTILALSLILGGGCRESHRPSQVQRSDRFPRCLCGGISLACV